MARRKPKRAERRLPPGRPIQATSPTATADTSRPPELSSEAAIRGDRAARASRLTYIAEVSKMVAGNEDANDREAERELRRFILNRLQFIEAEDPSPSELVEAQDPIPQPEWVTRLRKAAALARLQQRQRELKDQ